MLRRDGFGNFEIRTDRSRDVNSMKWRYAEPIDVPKINALIARSIRLLHAGHYDDATIEESVLHAYGVDWQLVHDGTYFVVEVDGLIAGAGGWSFRETIAGAHGPDDPPGTVLDPARHAAKVRAFYVDPHYVRRGIGTRVLRLSEDGASRAGFRRVELTSTLPAIPFYLTAGYVSVRSFDLPLPSKRNLRLELMEKVLPQCPDAVAV